MVRPRVIVHSAVSLDGRLSGFETDVGLYYEIAGRLGAQAILSGSNTVLSGFAAGPENDPPAETPPPSSSDDRPVLVVVDSRGRIDFWERIRRQPYWRGVIALGSQATPASALAIQQSAGIDSVVAGKRRVDLAKALSRIAEPHGVRIVRVDAGGRLIGALLRASLVDEVSLLIHPVLAGSAGTLPLVAGRLGTMWRGSGFGPSSMEGLRGGVLWLRTARPEETDST
jgi:2,5-diamino-6-(ribosylamino)-4(3H)-pyrimidinone 5'-phosphate reductase